MPSLESIAAVTIAGLTLSLTPGASMLYVLSRTAAQGRMAGYVSALGLCFGGILLAAATAFGLAILFARFEWIAWLLRHVGSVYLAWLGVAMIRETRTNSDTKVACTERQSLRRIFWQGTLVEVMNPKTVLFFALFLPPFVALDPSAVIDREITLQLLILGVLVPLTAVPSDLLVVTVGATMTQRFEAGGRIQAELTWTGGLILIGIAASLSLDLF